MLMTQAAMRTYNADAVKRALRQGPVLLFGAGNVGRQIQTLLRANGIEVTAFLDNYRAGETIDGVSIIGPAEGSLRYGARGVFVTTSWRPATTGGMSGMRQQLLDLGCENVMPFPWILWAFNGPSHYLWDHPAKMEAERDSIREAADLFHDEFSRDLFRRHVAFRETADPDVLPALATHPQYFPEFLAPAERECFIDCGAYTGDTLQPLCDWNPGFARAIAFEADPGTFPKLQQYTRDAGLADRVDCRPFAVSARDGVLRFSGTGASSAAIQADGDVEVRAVTLDSQLLDVEPTFIKMDIEGAEIQALQGARQVIRRAAPVLAICVYHKQSDLWRIPHLLHEMLPDSTLFLRSYLLDGLETVCYSVPRNRLR